MTDKADIGASINASLKANLKRIMIDDDLTVVMLAEFSGITKKCLRDILHEVHVPNITTICMLAKVLRVSLDELIPKEAYL